MDNLIASCWSFIANITYPIVAFKNSIPILNFIDIDNLNETSMTIIFIVFMILLSITNKVRSYAPDSKTRPLPANIKLLKMMGCTITFGFMLIFIFSLVYNLIEFLYFYSISNTISNNMNNTSYAESILISYALLFLYTLSMTLFYRHKSSLPFVGNLTDKYIISKLDTISTGFYAKNSNKKLYNPEGKERNSKNFSVDKFMKHGFLFHGLDDSNKPIYTNLSKSMDGHFTIMGGTGCGKGVLTRMYLQQTISHDITNIIIDVKPDHHLYDSCLAFSQKNGKKIYTIDIDSTSPQISLFESINYTAFAQIIISSLELEHLKNTNAKVHAVRQEEAIYEIAKNIFTNNITPNEILEKFKIFPELIKDDVVKAFFNALDRAGLFNTKNGLNLKSLIESGSVIYIRCSNAKRNSNTRNILQTLIMTIFEHINSRNPLNSKQCLLFIDEFKFSMNSSIMDNLATVRGQKCSLVFNFQDISNFMTSPNHALRNKCYPQELISNSHFIAIHNISDIELISLIQERCGLTEFDKSFEHVDATTAGTNETSHSRKWTKHIEYKLTKNEIQNGEKRTAILLSSMFNEGYIRTHTDFTPVNSSTFKISHISSLYEPTPIQIVSKETENKIKKIKTTKDEFIDI